MYGSVASGWALRRCLSEPGHRFVWHSGVVVRPRDLMPRFRVLGVVAGLCALALVVAAIAANRLDRGAVGGPDSPPLQLPEASAGVVGVCGGQPLTAPREMRGMTLTTVYNIDWPSQGGLDQETVKSQYRAWLDLAQKMRHNAIFVHIRPSGDAFWPSQYAPWSDWLTGKRDGVSPGWDPLAFMIAETHARDLEFYGWFNPYRGGQPAPRGAGGDLNQLAPNHPLRAHPEWSVVYPVGTTGSRLYFDPGIPAARAFVEDSMLEAVQKYDLDGVFFDDFFYPYPEAGQAFNDAGSFATYGGGFASKADWRRNNVNTLVQEMNQRIKALKPWVKFGISPFGIWRNDTTDGSGSPTKGLQSYDEIFVDTKLWVTKGWLDFVMPQLYWHIGFDRADFAKLLPWWVGVVKGTKVQLIIAHGDYRVGEDGAWKDPAELDRQLALGRQYGVSGSVHYSANDIRDDALGAISRYTAAHYSKPALVPVKPGLPVTVPAAPELIGASRDPAGATTVKWRPGPGAAATSFGVYRVDGAAATLVATVRRTGTGEHSWVDRTPPAGPVHEYCVTGLDRLWNEGAPSAAVKVI
jgi:uncharacterized lipoprotein YddW (UPF0748 family)